MIVQLRGTSGSGKSTLARQIMEKHPDLKPVHVTGRKQPILMRGPRLSVLGHYNTACGGCDTIGTMDEIYDRVRQEHARGNNVLFEGLLISSEYRRTLELHKDLGCLHLIHVQIPIEDCLESIMQRRRTAAEKRGKPLDEVKQVKPDNTVSKHKQTDSCMRSFIEDGVPCFTGDREECMREALRLLCD